MNDHTRMNGYQVTLRASRRSCTSSPPPAIVLARPKPALRRFLDFAGIIVPCVAVLAAFPKAVGAEMLGDPAFELSSADGTFPEHSWRPAWAPLEAGAVCTDTAGRTGHGLWAYTGPRPIEFWTGAYQEFEVQPGRVYRASAWIRTPPGESWVDGSRALARLLLMDATGKTLNTFDSPAITAPQTDWQRVEVVSTPATGAVARVRFVCYLEKPQVAGQSICNFDDTSLVAEETAPGPTGTGLFNPGPWLGAGGRRVALADVNNDGYLDVISGADTNLVNINNGFGEFTPTGQHFGGAGSWALAAGDVNGDGNVDVFLNKDHQMELWFGIGDGTFADSRQRLGYGTIRKAFLADLNGDQHPDLILAFELDSNEVYLNDGRGRFTWNRQWLDADATRSYAGVAFDADGDGDLDLVFAGWEMGPFAAAPLSLFLNDGQAQFTKAEPDFGESGRQNLAAAAGDLDGDGKPDLVVTGYGFLEVWRNTGGRFTKAQEAMCWAPPWDVALVDVDQDGDLDVITANAISQGSVSEIWLNDGTGHLLNSGRHLCCANSFGIAVGDLNADGSPDLVLSGSSGRVWFNQPTPPLLSLDPLTDGRLAGRTSGLELSVWRSYFKAYVAAYVPGEGWSTPQGCDGNLFTPLDEAGRFAVSGIPQTATRIVAVLAPTGANVSHLPCLTHAEDLPAELDLLGLAKTVVERAKLTAAVEAGQLTLRWASDLTNAKLESASEITGPWSTVTVDTPGEYRSKPNSAHTFFRLR